MKKPLSKLERVPLREAWKHEANDFTPWLAQEDNLNTLADALGLPDLELVATEHWVGEFKLDILCTSGDDQVIIENQLEETDHKHLGQILAYAAGVGAKKVIWVADSFRPEHASALEFLNDNTTDDLLRLTHKHEHPLDDIDEFINTVLLGYPKRHPWDDVWIMERENEITPRQNISSDEDQ